MKPSTYREFTFSLLTLGPVHVGSGIQYTSKEFIYEKGNYYFPDMGIFYSKMLEDGYGEKFERFLQKQGGGSAANNRLVSFLSDNRIRRRDFGGYKIKESGLERDRDVKGRGSGAINEVAQFMRDPYGQPYIPGSSLKGAIRTILMNTVWAKTNFVTGYGNKMHENKNIIPWGPKFKQDFDDIFNAIRVSDSEPIALNHLILVQKWDYSVKSKVNKLKSLPLYREALEPLTKVDFTIMTTTKEAGDLMAKLGSYAQEFYRNYAAFFLEDFPSEFAQPNFQYPIYLGAGSGAWTKTVFKQADGILQKRYSRMRTKMVRKGVLKLTKAPAKSVRTQTADRKLIKNTDNLYEMGKANFLIKENAK